MIRLGKRGYRSIMLNLTRTADYLAACLEQLGFILMSKTGGKGLPLVAFRLDPAKGHHYDEFAIAHNLRERGWVVPAYTMAPHSEKLKLMRVVVREDFSRSRCDALIKDFKLACETLDAMDKPTIEKHKEYVTTVRNRLILDLAIHGDHLLTTKLGMSRNIPRTERRSQTTSVIRTRNTRYKARLAKYVVYSLLPHLSLTSTTNCCLDTCCVLDTIFSLGDRQSSVTNLVASCYRKVPVILACNHGMNDNLKVPYPS